MGSRSSTRCKGRLEAVLSARYGFAHQAQIPVRRLPSPAKPQTFGLTRAVSTRQVGQTSKDEVKKRDLRAELMAAEHEARNKKRKAEGLPPLELETSAPKTEAINAGGGDEESNKRRKLLQEALELDKDDEDDEEEKANDKNKSDEEEDRSVFLFFFPCFFLRHGISDEDSDEEDETAELLRELEKIKRERAEEKARIEAEESATKAASREAEIATANPLLNLAAALGQAPGLNTTVPGTFQVKKRWDDGEHPYFDSDRGYTDFLKT